MEFLQTFLFSDFLGTPAYFWLIFISVVIGLLVLDLGVLHKGQKEIEAKESFLLYGGYMAIAAAFGARHEQMPWETGTHQGIKQVFTETEATAGTGKEGRDAARADAAVEG